MFSVYILKSLICDKYYVGQTEALEKRLKFHNSNRARWTKRFQPWKVIYEEKCETRSEAMKRELVLKRKKNIKYLTGSGAS